MSGNLKNFHSRDYWLASLFEFDLSLTYHESMKQLFESCTTGVCWICFRIRSILVWTTAHLIMKFDAKSVQMLLFYSIACLQCWAVQINSNELLILSITQILEFQLIVQVWEACKIMLTIIDICCLIFHLLRQLPVIAVIFVLTNSCEYYAKFSWTCKYRNSQLVRKFYGLRNKVTALFELAKSTNLSYALISIIKHTKFIKYFKFILVNQWLFEFSVGICLLPIRWMQSRDFRCYFFGNCQDPPETAKNRGCRYQR